MTTPKRRARPGDVVPDVEDEDLPSSSGPRGRRAANPLAVRDREWLERIRGGDAAAFEHLFLEYTPRLCAFAFRYVHSREEAQEIVQDLFVWLWQHRDDLEVQGALSSYLYTAVRHQSINRLRREQVRERWRRGTLALVTSETPGGADVELERAERHAAIERAIAELPDRRRAICVLRWVEGLSYAAIAQRLGISEKTVDGQLQRALQQIRRSVTGF